jgi:hypothetical protein
MTRHRHCYWLVTAGGRKFFMAMGAGIVDTLLLVFGYLDIAAYVTLTLGTVGAYLVADVMEQKVAPRNTELVQ